MNDNIDRILVVTQVVNFINNYTKQEKEINNIFKNTYPILKEMLRCYYDLNHQTADYISEKIGKKFFKNKKSVERIRNFTERSNLIYTSINFLNDLYTGNITFVDNKDKIADLVASIDEYIGALEYIRNNKLVLIDITHNNVPFRELVTNEMLDAQIWLYKALSKSIISLYKYYYSSKNIILSKYILENEDMCSDEMINRIRRHIETNTLSTIDLHTLEMEFSRLALEAGEDDLELFYNIVNQIDNIILEASIKDIKRQTF